METIQHFIERNRIKMRCTPVDRNPHMDDMPAGSMHYRCTLRKVGGKRMTVFFSQGPAHTREPSAADVLNCLASDASDILSGHTFEDWCDNLGYDQDSRKAERTYKAIAKQREQLERILGRDAMEALCFETERL